MQLQQTAPLELGLPVMDLDRMVNFYCDALGCEEVRRADIPAELSSRIRIAEHGYTNVWLKFPGGEIIKLVRPTRPPRQRLAPAQASEETGLAYFTLYCADIAGAISGAEAQGATLVSDPGLTGSSEGVQLAFLRDPEGNLFEFVQVPAA